ncbi:MAG: diguanylate cyclase, partial [Rikenellaceae bacterium]
PIIASINCTSRGEWVEFCKRMEYAGADAIELNIFHLPISKNESSSSIENSYLNIASAVVESVKIPVCVKLSSRFTNHLINELYNRGVKAVTMFNRFWEPDFDIEKRIITSQEILSNHSEMRSNIRLIGQASAEIQTIDYCASTGVSTWEDIVKFILAGASTVQLCSALYRDGAHIIKNSNNKIERWMKSQSLESIGEFKGSLNFSNTTDNIAYERCQFMKQFGGYSN